VIVFLAWNLFPHGRQNASPSVLCSSSFLVPCLNKLCLLNVSFGVLRKWRQNWKLSIIISPHYCNWDSLYVFCITGTMLTKVCSNMKDSSVRYTRNHCCSLNPIIRFCVECVKLNCSVFWDHCTKEALSRTEVPL